MPFLIMRNDITHVNVDAIVNPANEVLQEGSGTSRAIYLAAGEEALDKACRKIGHCDTGQAVITKGYGLSARYIIHAVGPTYIDGMHGEEQYLYNAYQNSMKLAAKHHCESLAFPLLSSGHYGYPRNQAMKVAAAAITDFLMENDMLIYMVLYDNDSLTVSQKLFMDVKQYIDDNYVNDNDESFPCQRGATTVLLDNSNCTFYGAALASAPRSLNSLVKNLGETFSQRLLRLIDERGMKDSVVYKKANVDRRHFSKIRKDVNYTPTKKTVLAFSIALELSMDETVDLLKCAGYAFSKSSMSDVIICYFIENEVYDIFEINETLFEYNQPTLGEI